MLAVATVLATVTAGPVRTSAATGSSSALALGPVVITEETKLVPAAALFGDVLGVSVALEGDTAVIGGDSPLGEGTAYVFTRAGTTWSEQAELVRDDPRGFDEYGSSVAVSGDTAVVGSPGGLDGRGAAYVFTRSGGTWSQQARLDPTPDDPTDMFGHDVAVSGDTVVVANNQDLVYVYVRTGTTWTEQARLVGPSPSFADSVALEGDTAAIGTQGAAAYVFVRTGTTWAQQAHLTGPDGFGTPVALSGDTVVVGASLDDTMGTLVGSAMVYTRTGAMWSRQATLTASDPNQGDQFGHSVAVSGDTAVLGAVSGDAPGVTDAGSAYVFTRSGSNWTERAKLVASDAAADDLFGRSAALDGSAALVGVPCDENCRGSGYVFDLSVLPQGPSLTIDNVSVVEGDGGKRTARFTVSLSNPATNPVSVRVSTVNGTARASIDYVPRTATVSFAPGQSAATFDVKVKGDTVVETDETFRVRLDKAMGATVGTGTGTGTGTIVDDD